MHMRTLQCIGGHLSRLKQPGSGGGVWPGDWALPTTCSRVPSQIVPKRTHIPSHIHHHTHYIHTPSHIHNHMYIPSHTHTITHIPSHTHHHTPHIPSHTTHTPSHTLISWVAYFSAFMKHQQLEEVSVIQHCRGHTCNLMYTHTTHITHTHATHT